MIDVILALLIMQRTPAPPVPPTPPPPPTYPNPSPDFPRPITVPRP